MTKIMPFPYQLPSQHLTTMTVAAAKFLVHIHFAVPVAGVVSDVAVVDVAFSDVSVSVHSVSVSAVVVCSDILQLL